MPSPGKCLMAQTMLCALMPSKYSLARSITTSGVLPNARVEMTVFRQL